jgi:hypothetical protein
VNGLRCLEKKKQNCERRAGASEGHERCDSGPGVAPDRHNRGSSPKGENCGDPEGYFVVWLDLSELRRATVWGDGEIPHRVLSVRVQR